MTTITTLPDAPSRTDPATFSDKSDALLGALATFVTETNAVAGECVTLAATATTQAGIATTQAGLATTNGAAQVTLAAAQVTLAAAQVTLATTQANNAAISATSAAGSALLAGATAWVSGTTYAIGDARYSPINLQTYRRKTTGGGTTDPNADSTNWARAVDSGGITNVVTATTATTLTSTPTLLKITPSIYGVAVTLPDATTCNIGGPLHIIDNKGAYSVRVLNSAGTLLGLIFAGVVSHVSLIDKSTAAGAWTVENSELVGPSAQLITSNMSSIDAVIDIGSNQEVIIGRGASSANCYGVVYNRSTNTFGSVTLIRTATLGASLVAACLSGTNQVLVCTVATGAATFEAVTLSISGTTITVNTAATATLSANISAFADGFGLIAVGSSFVCSYTVATPAAQIRALSISGTTVTIGSATVLDGTAGGLIALGDSTHVIAASSATTHLYTKPYLVSGSTLTAGTGTDTNSGTMTLNKLAALGTRWYIGYNDGGATVKGGVISLSASGNGTTTISAATLFSAGSIQDAIIVGTTKVFVVNDQATNNANILTDTAGTASAGTAITLNSQTAHACLYVYGTDVAVASGTTLGYMSTVDCSGASPIKAKEYILGSIGSGLTFTPSNSVLNKSSTSLTGTAFAQRLVTIFHSTTSVFQWQVKNGEVHNAPTFRPLMSSSTTARGRNDSERWNSTATLITKFECVV